MSIMVARVVLAVVCVYLVAVEVSAYNSTQPPPVDDDPYYSGSSGSGSGVGQGCNSTSAHSISLGGQQRTIYTCVDDSVDTLCLRDVRMSECSKTLSPGQCDVFHQSSGSKPWNITLCQNPFAPGHCFLESSLPVCPEDDEVCSCTDEKEEPATSATPTTSSETETTMKPDTVTPGVSKGSGVFRINYVISLAIPILICAKF